MTPQSMRKEFAYPEQTRILAEVLAETNGLHLLIEKMRQEYWRQLRCCQSKEELTERRKRLSCVFWFIGKAWQRKEDFLKIDHWYFVESSSIGVGVSIHPQDSWKAAEPFIHPHQTEVILPVEGTIELQTLEQGRVVSRSLSAGDLRLIPSNVCHRIAYRDLDGSNASYFFIKTCLWKEPDKKGCSECELKGQCELQKWFEEERASVDLSSLKCRHCGGSGYTMYRRDLSGAWDDIPCECNPDGEEIHHRWTE